MNNYKIVIDAGHGRYYYAKTNISMLRLIDTINIILKYLSRNIVLGFFLNFMSLICT